MNVLNKLLKYILLLALWFVVSIGILTVIVATYCEVAEPETFTLFEKVMSFIVSVQMAEKFLDFVFKALEEGADG